MLPQFGEASSLNCCLINLFSGTFPYIFFYFTSNRDFHGLTAKSDFKLQQPESGLCWEGKKSPFLDWSRFTGWKGMPP